MSKQIVVPAETFDQLTMMVEAFGGVGAGEFVDYNDVIETHGLYRHDFVPYCIVGMLNTFPDALRKSMSNDEKLPEALFDAELNDAAVKAINRRKGLRNERLEERVSWKEYCMERNIHRADS